MYITSRMVFCLLSRVFEIHCRERDHKSVPVRQARLYRGQATKPGCLYLLDELVDLTAVGPPAGCAFLVVASTPLKLPDMFREADAAFVTGNVNKLDLYDTLCDRLYELVEWELTLEDALFQGMMPVKLMETGSRFLSVPMVLYDGEQRILRGVETGQADGDTYDLFLDMGYRMHSGSEEVYVYAPEDEENGKVACKNILLDGQVVAVFLAFYENAGVRAGELELFSCLAGYVSAAYLNNTASGRNRRGNDAQHKVLSRILYQENYGVTPEDRVALLRFGWREEHEYRVAFMRPIRKEGSNLDHSYIRGYLENDWSDTCVLPDGKDFAWIINMSLCAARLEEFREYLTGFIREHMLQVGISNPMPGISGLAYLYQQACEVFYIGLRKNPHLWLFEFGDYLLDYIFEKFSCEFSAEQAVHPGIYRLMAYDAKHGTDYVKTLRVYIENQFRASEAAQQLYVHRSTFLRRMNRVEEIAGLRLEDSDEILHVMISLKLCQMMHPTQSHIFDNTNDFD